MDTDRLFIPNEWLQNLWNSSVKWFILPVCLRLLWALLQNMKYTKSRGLQGPNIFVALSCTGFLSAFFAAKYWSYISPHSQHCQHNQPSAKPPLHHYRGEPNRVYEPNTKRNAEYWIQINRPNWKTSKNSNIDFWRRSSRRGGIMNIQEFDSTHPNCFQLCNRSCGNKLSQYDLVACVTFISFCRNDTMI